MSPAPGSVTEAVNVAHDGFFADDQLVPPLVPRWNVDIKHALGVVAAEGRVFVAREGGVTALDQRDGKQVWTASLPEFARGPAYDDGRIFVVTEHSLFALDAKTGRRLWEYTAPYAFFPGHPVASGGAVYSNFDTNGTMTALSAADGKVLWVTNTYMQTGSAPTLDNDRLYMQGCGVSAAGLDRRSGGVLWSKRDCSGGANQAFALHAGRGYIGGFEFDSRPDEGQPIYDAVNGSAVGTFRGARPIFVDGLAVFRTLETVTARSVGSDEQAWSVKGPLVDPIAIGHDIYGMRQDTIRALDSETGRELWVEKLRAAPKGQEGLPGLAAAPGLLLVYGRGRVVAYQSELSPAARALALRGYSDAYSGDAIQLYGVLGRDLRGGRPSVEIQAAPWKGGQFRRVETAKSARDGGFDLGVNLFRNARFRASASGVTSKPWTVYAHPRFTLAKRARHAGPNRIGLGVSVRTANVRLGGRTLALYLQRHKAKRLVRLATARLRATGRFKAHATLVFQPLRRVGRKDLVVVCVRGQLQLDLGRPDAFTRDCGGRTVRVPSGG